MIVTEDSVIWQIVFLTDVTIDRIPSIVMKKMSSVLKTVFRKQRIGQNQTASVRVKESKRVQESRGNRRGESKTVKTANCCVEKTL